MAQIADRARGKMGAERGGYTRRGVSAVVMRRGAEP